MSLKDAKKKVTWLKRYGAKATNTAHAACLDMEDHINECGDWTYLGVIREQVRACKLGIEKFDAWVVLAFPNLKIEKDILMRRKKKEPVTVNADILVQHWDDVVEVRVAKFNYDALLDVEKLIEQALKREQKAIDEGQEIKGDKAAFEARVKELAQFANA